MAEEITRGGEEDKFIPRAFMAEPPNGGSTPADSNSKSDGSNQSNQSDCSVCPSPSTRNTSTSEANGKVKSCKGCLYYSSRFKADSRNPLCVGIGRSLPNVPEYIAGKSVVEESKDGKALIGFRYACVGYSLYNDRKGQTSGGQRTQTELPSCAGLEVLVAERLKAASSASAPAPAPAPAPTPAHIHNKGDGDGLPQKGPPKPTHATGDEFLTRFTRNANLVANGVAKNIRRVGNQIKQSLDDIMYRRPK